MTGFRNRFINLTHSLANAIPTKHLLKWSGQHTILPFYHCISDTPLPHISQLYTVKNTRAFEEDLDFLLKYFEPVDYFQFKEMTYNPKNQKKPSFLLTFDDGLKEFHDVIAPILLKKGIPAVCFLNSAFIDNKGLFYRYKASLLINYLSKNRAIQKLKPLKDWMDNHNLTGKELPSFILSINYANQHLLDEIATLFGYDFNIFLTEHTPYLNSTQIKELKSQGFQFGAHSIDHPLYNELNHQEQLDQTKESINFVTKQFELDYTTFSFPFTDHGISERLLEELQKERIVELSFGCAGQKKDPNPYHFQRIPFETNELSAKAILNSELLYYLMKAPLGKNTIQRS